jgi:hypothetical protein
MTNLQEDNWIFALGINMAGLAPRRSTRNKEADPCDRPQKGERDLSRKNK